MASCGILELSGSLRIQGDSCASTCAGAGAPATKVQPISLRCVANRPVVSSDCGIQIATAGTAGDNFVDLPVVGALDRVEVLWFVASTGFVILRLVQNGTGVAQLTTVATFPTGFGGGETLELGIDALPNFTTTFTAAAQAAQDVGNEINAAAALAGLTFLPASVNTAGQVVIAGVRTGPQRGAATTTEEGSVNPVSGTALATLGLTAGATVYGNGADTRVEGNYGPVEFGRDTNAPDRVLMSGNSDVTILAAGKVP